MEKKQLEWNRFLWVIPLALTMIYFIILFSNFTVSFSRPDDIKMRNIASGYMTGKPSAYLVYIKYPFGYLISKLYQYFGNIQWYGMIFLFIHYICLFCILCRTFFLAFPNKWRCLIYLSAGLFVYTYLNFSNMIHLEFTVTASLCGATALFLFATRNHRSMMVYGGHIAGDIAAVALLVLCYCLRKSCFIMVLPIFLLISFFECIADGPLKGVCIKYFLKREFLRKLFAFRNWWILLSVFVCVLGVKMIDDYAYSIHGWDGFKEYSSERSYLYDYNRIPNYETYSDFYTKEGIGRPVYESIVDYNIVFSEQVTPHTIHALYTKSLEAGRERTGASLLDGILLAYETAFQSQFAYMTIFVIMLAVLSIGLAVKNHAYEDSLQLCIYLAVFLAEWIYLGHGGRFPERVVWSLLLSDGFIHFGFLLKGLSRCSILPMKQILVKGLPLICLCAVTLLLANSVKFSLEFNEITNQLDRLRASDVLEDYLQAHSDNIYILTTHIISRNYTDQINDQKTDLANYFELGGWEAFSPCYYEMLAGHGVSSVENMLLQRTDAYLLTDEPDTVAYMTEYLSGKYGGVTADITDQFTDTGNRIYYIYKFYVSK